MFKSLSIKSITLLNFTITVSVLLLTYIWAGVILLELNLYSTFSISIFSILVIGIFVIFYSYHIFRKVKLIFSRLDIVAICIVAFFCILNVFYFHEGFSGGRDDGVYANIALYIAKHHSLYINNSLAITYPGFLQTTKGITTQFYPGYSSWISTLFTLFGPASIKYVNLPFIFLGLLLIYSLGKILFRSSLSIAVILLLSTSFPFFWFTRETFTENIFFFITWFIAICVVRSFQTKNLFYLLASFLGVGVLMTIRVEAIAFLATLSVIGLFGLITRYLNGSIITRTAIFICSILFFIPAVYFYLIIDPRYMHEITITLSNLLTQVLSHIQKGNAITKKGVQYGKDIVEYNQPELTLFLLQLYNLYFFIIFIPIAISRSINSNRSVNKYLFLLLFVLILPNFYFLYNPSINLDQPWFLRRYISVIIPFGVLAFCYVLSGVNRQFRIIIISLLIVINLYIAGPIITFQEYNGANRTLATNLGSFFKSNDLVLVDYGNTGHFKIAEPLYFLYNVHTAAVDESSLQRLLGENVSTGSSLYTDTAFSIPRSSVCKFDNIYLITTKQINDIKDIVQGKARSVRQFSIEYPELNKTCELFRLSTNTSLESMAHVQVPDVLSFCDTLPNTTYISDTKLDVLQLNDNLKQQIKNYSCKKI